MSAEDLRRLAAYDQARAERPRARTCDVCGHPIREDASFVAERTITPVYGRIGEPSSNLSGFTAGPMRHRHTTRCPEGP